MRRGWYVRWAGATWIQESGAGQSRVAGGAEYAVHGVNGMVWGRECACGVIGRRAEGIGEKQDGARSAAVSHMQSPAVMTSADYLPGAVQVSTRNRRQPVPRCATGGPMIQIMMHDLCSYMRLCGTIARGSSKGEKGGAEQSGSAGRQKGVAGPRGKGGECTALRAQVYNAWYGPGRGGMCENGV